MIPSATHVAAVVFDLDGVLIDSEPVGMSTHESSTYVSWGLPPELLAVAVVIARPQSCGRNVTWSSRPSPARRRPL